MIQHCKQCLLFIKNPEFKCLKEEGYLKTLWEKNEKMLVTSNFSFSNYVLHSFQEIIISMAINKYFQFCCVQIHVKRLALYLTVSQKEAFCKYCGERRKCWYKPAFSAFPSMFSTILKSIFYHIYFLFCKFFQFGLV